jgi:DDE family transposase
MPVLWGYEESCNKTPHPTRRAFQVKKENHRKLRNRKRRIGHRLRDREWTEQASPMLAGRNLQYELSERTRGLDTGGIGLMHRLAQQVGLVDEIDRRLSIFKVHLPYHESDHVLNIAYNALCGGQCLEDIEWRRNNEVYLDALGASRVPDPTTAGDFCRRFAAPDIEALVTAVNETRLRVWKKQPLEFFAEATIEADGLLAPTTGECKEGMDVSYNGIWGYHPLLMSLANTSEPLFLVNRSGNRPSYEGAAERFDQARSLCRRAGFRKITFRGDTDFSQTQHLDAWDADGVRFIFGLDARSNLVGLADCLPKQAWERLRRPPKYEIATEERRRPENVKDIKVIEREFENIRLRSEDVASFVYTPTACTKSYRIVVVRKNLTIEKGGWHLFDDIRYFFYITNDLEAAAAEIVLEANARCNQENLIAQLKGMRATRMPVDTLLSNWAYMVMASLAWTLKAWFALLLPEGGRWREKYREEKQEVLRMEFRTFLNAFIRVPAQVIRTGRRIVFRLLSWNRWQHVFLRGADCLAGASLRM